MALEQSRAQPEAEEVRLEERREPEKYRRRTRGHAFVAAMGRIREEMVQQYEDDLERRIRERMRGDYGSDSDEEDY